MKARLLGASDFLIERTIVFYLVGRQLLKPPLIAQSLLDSRGSWLHISLTFQCSPCLALKKAILPEIGALNICCLIDFFTILSLAALVKLTLRFQRSLMMREICWQVQFGCSFEHLLNCVLKKLMQSYLSAFLMPLVFSALGSASSFSRGVASRSLSFFESDWFSSFWALFLELVLFISLGRPNLSGVMVGFCCKFKLSSIWGTLASISQLICCSEVRRFHSLTILAVSCLLLISGLDWRYS